MVDESTYVILSDLEEGEIPDFENDDKYPRGRCNAFHVLNNKEKTLYNEDELQEALSTYYSASHLDHDRKYLSSICYQGSTMKGNSADRNKKGNAKLEMTPSKKRHSESSKMGKRHTKYSSQANNNLKNNRLRKPLVDSCLDFFHKQRIKALSKVVVSHSTENIDLSSCSVSDKTLKTILKSKQNEETPKKCNNSNDSQSKEVIPPVNAVPGSLGEMLVKRQLEGKLKCNPSKILNGISESKACKFGSEFNDDDEEDELTLRYIALQSAVKSLASRNEKADNSEFVVNSNIISSFIKNNAEKCEKSSSSLVPCLEFGGKNYSNTFSKQLSCISSVENSAIDMEISSDSSTELPVYIRKDTPENIIETESTSFFPTTLSETIQEDANSNNTNCSQNTSHFTSENFEKEHLLSSSHLDIGNSQSFPVEWAYMIPPPSQLNQPANDINSINNWVYNQNMCIQNQTMLDSCIHLHSIQNQSDIILSKSFHDNLNDSCSSNKETDLSSNEKFIHSVNYDYKPADEIDQSIESVCDLRDNHEQQYRSFMSSILHHQNTQVMKSENEEQKSLKRLNKNAATAIRTLTVIPIDKGKDLSTLTKPPIGRKRTRRRRKSSKGIDISTNMDRGVSSENTSMISDFKNKKLNCIDDDDEDLLRAQLLKSMSLNNVGEETQRLSKHTFPLQNIKKQKSLGSNFESDKKLGHLNNVSVKRSNVSQSVNQLQVKGREVLKRKMRVSKKKNASTLDIGSKYLGTKSPFSEPSFLNRTDIPHFKFPTIKPVIITLNDDSDTTDEDVNYESKSLTAKVKDQKTKVNKEVSSSIDNLLKSMRNCNNVDENKSEKNGIKDAFTKSYSNVSFLSERKQEEYKKLKQLLSKKKQQLQVKADPISNRGLQLKRSGKGVRMKENFTVVGGAGSNPILERKRECFEKEFPISDEAVSENTPGYSTSNDEKDSFIFNCKSCSTNISCLDHPSGSNYKPRSDKLPVIRDRFSVAGDEMNLSLIGNSALREGKLVTDVELRNGDENKEVDQLVLDGGKKIFVDDHDNFEFESIQKYPALDPIEHIANQNDENKEVDQLGLDLEKKIIVDDHVNFESESNLRCHILDPIEHLPYKNEENKEVDQLLVDVENKILVKDHVNFESKNANVNFESKNAQKCPALDLIAHLANQSDKNKEVDQLAFDVEKKILVDDHVNFEVKNAQLCPALDPIAHLANQNDVNKEVDQLAFDVEKKILVEDHVNFESKNAQKPPALDPIAHLANQNYVNKEVDQLAFNVEKKILVEDHVNFESKNAQKPLAIDPFAHLANQNDDNKAVDQLAFDGEKKILVEDYVNFELKNAQKCSALDPNEHLSVFDSSSAKRDTSPYHESNSSSTSSDEDSTSSSSSSSSSSESSDEESSDSDNYNLSEEFLRKKLLSKRQNLLQQKTIRDTSKEAVPTNFKRSAMPFRFLQSEKPMVDTVNKNDEYLESSSKNEANKECATMYVLEDGKNLKEELAENIVMEVENNIKESASNKLNFIPKQDQKIINEIDISFVPKERNQSDQVENELQSMFEIDTVGNIDNISFLKENRTTIAGDKKESLLVLASKTYDLPNCSCDVQSCFEINDVNDTQNFPTLKAESAVSLTTTTLSIPIIEDKNIVHPSKSYINSSSKLKSFNYDESSAKLRKPNVNSNLQFNGSKKYINKMKFNRGEEKLMDCHYSAKENVNSYDDQKLKLLKKIREECSKKCLSIYELNKQISGLVEEATKDVTLRQSILNQISKLYTQLEKFHTEEKKMALSIQNKVQKLLKLQQKLDEDKKRLGELQHYGKEVACSKSFNNEDRNIIFKKHDLERKQLMLKINFLEQSLKSREESSGNHLQVGNKLYRQEKSLNDTDKNLGAGSAVSFRKMSSSAIGTNEDQKKVSAANSNNLDVLCPYDLLGRCNDDHCTYKHTSTNCHKSISSIINISKDAQDSETSEGFSQLTQASQCLHKSSETQKTKLVNADVNNSACFVQKTLLNPLNQNSCKAFHKSPSIFKRKNIFLHSFKKSSNTSIPAELLNDDKIGTELVLLPRINYNETYLMSFNYKAAPKSKKSKPIEQVAMIQGKKQSYKIVPSTTDIEQSSITDDCKDNICSQSQFMHKNMKNLNLSDIFSQNCLLKKKADDFSPCFSSIDTNSEANPADEIQNVKGIQKVITEDNTNCKPMSIGRPRRQSAKNFSSQFEYPKNKRFCKRLKNDAEGETSSSGENGSNSLPSQKTLQEKYICNTELKIAASKQLRRKTQEHSQITQNVTDQLRTRQSTRLRKKK